MIRTQFMQLWMAIKWDISPVLGTKPGFLRPQAAHSVDKLPMSGRARRSSSVFIMESNLLNVGMVTRGLWSVYGFESPKLGQNTYGSVSKPCTPGEHQNSWDLWMFIPLKIVLIGIDPYTYRHIGREWMQDLIKIKSCFNASWSVRVSRSMVHGSTRELILYLWGLEQYLLRELNLELILFILALILPALSSLFFSTLLVFILPSSFQLFLFLLYLLHPSDSFPFSSLLFTSSLFKCTCPKFNCNSWYRISWQGVKSWVNSVHIGSDTSCSFFPLLLYSACIYSSLFFSTLFFSFTFSTLLILSLSLLYSFHVVSLSAIARSLTVIVDIGSLDKELNLELILFILALIPPALSVGMGSLEKELNLELILFLLALIPHALSSLFLPTLLVYIRPFSFQLSCFSFTFSIPSDSLPVSSLLFSCSLFKCNCPKFNCNSWYRISWEGH